MHVMKTNTLDNVSIDRIKKEIEPIIASLIDIATVTNVKDAATSLEKFVQYIYGYKNHEVDEKLQANVLYALDILRSIKAQDSEESVMVALYVVSQILGLHKLSQDSIEDQLIGLKLLKSSGEAITNLCDKRIESIQNRA